MSPENKERHDLSDHDLLIRIDERVERVEGCIEKMNNLRPRMLRLEALLGVFFISGGGVGISKLAGAF